MNKGYYYDTCIGRIGIIENGNAITNLYFDKIEMKAIEYVETPILKEAIRQLQEYLSGLRSIFTLNLEPDGTKFQKDVWKALQEIPYGTTFSYKQIAEKVGNIKASRAVGMANNRNPIPIFIPCHRVIGANGKLVGYGGGLDIKEKLLKIEMQ